MNTSIAIEEYSHPFHPYRDYISIYIEPSRRNKGFGKLLFQLSGDDMVKIPETIINLNYSS